LPTPVAPPPNIRVLAVATDQVTGDTSNNSFNIAATSFPMIADDALTPVIHEGEQATLSGRLVDPSPRDVLSLRVDWGDGSPAQVFHPGVAPFALPHRYLDDGTYDVTFSWFAQRGGVKSRTRSVTVLNLPPALADAALRPLAPRLGIVLLSGTV